MAKILISFLGTGSVDEKSKKETREYRTVKYEIEAKIYEESFVTKVLDTHYNIDKILYIGTLRSMWEEVYRTYIGEDGEFADSYLELHDVVPQFNKDSKVVEHEYKILKHFEHQKKLVPILIQYGLNKEEINFNIQQILKCEELINDGDQIYIDITHSFRSLPLLIMNVLNYLKDVSKKSFVIKGISYGMLDIMKENDGIAPIVQLDAITELHENIKAAHEFNEYGNAFLFSDLLKESCKSMSKILLDFSLSKNLNHIHDLKQKIIQFNSFKNEYENLTSIQKMTIPKTIENFVSRFNQNDQDSKFQYHLAKWMFDKKQYGFSSIVLIESLVSKVCELNGLNSNDKKNRDLAKNMIVLSGKSKTNINKEIVKLERIYHLNGSEVSLLKKALKNPIYSSFQSLWGQSNNIRKSVSHAIENKHNGDSLVRDLKSQIKEVLTLIELKRF